MPITTILTWPLFCQPISANPTGCSPIVGSSSTCSAETAYVLPSDHFLCAAEETAAGLVRSRGCSEGHP